MTPAFVPAVISQASARNERETTVGREVQRGFTRCRRRGDKSALECLAQVRGHVALLAAARDRDNQVRCRQTPATPHEVDDRARFRLQRQADVLRQASDRAQFILIELQVAVLVGYIARRRIADGKTGGRRTRGNARFMVGHVNV